MLALAFLAAAAMDAPSDRAEMARLAAKVVALNRRPTLGLLVTPRSWTEAAHEQILLDAARDQLRRRGIALARQMTASERFARTGFGADDLAPPSARRAARAAIVPAGTAPYRLPAPGRLLAGFGTIDDRGVRARGITLLPEEGAMLRVPGAGRVAYAGRYHGYGDVLIVEHGHGWTTLIAGGHLDGFDLGTQLSGDQPIGTAHGPLLVELRRGGQPVDVLALAQRIGGSAISQTELSR